MFYSASASGFFSREIHGNNIPVDAVQITKELYESLLEGQTRGLLISANESGEPVLVSPPPPIPDAPDYQAQIEALEREHQAPGWQRDAWLGLFEREAVAAGAVQGLTPEQSIAALRAGNSGYRKLKELDEQIAALRAML